MLWGYERATGISKSKKHQNLIKEFRGVLETGKELIISRLESIRVFCIYMSQIYWYLNPYLERVNLMTDRLIPEKDEKYWKIPTCHILEGQYDGKWNILYQGG